MQEFMTRYVNKVCEFQGARPNVFSLSWNKLLVMQSGNAIDVVDVGPSHTEFGSTIARVMVKRSRKGQAFYLVDEVDGHVWLWFGLDNNLGTLFFHTYQKGFTRCTQQIEIADSTLDFLFEERG